MIGDLLSDAFAKSPHRKKLKQALAIGYWKEVVGEHISFHTEKIWFDGDKMMVKMKSPAWRHELHLQRFVITKKLNLRVGEQVIEEIRTLE